MRRVLSLGISVLDKQGNPIKTFPTGRMSFNDNAVCEAKKFGIDLENDVDAMAIAQIVQGLNKAWSEIITFIQNEDIDS